MESLCDEILLKIFKHLDLATRVEVAQMCGRWRRLIFDPEAALDDDISEVRLDVWRSFEDAPADAKANARSILAHLLDRPRIRLNFASEFVKKDILADQEMRACFGRFEKFVVLAKNDDEEYYENESKCSYWSQLPTSMKHVTIDGSGYDQFDLRVFSSNESMQLESLDLKLYQLDNISCIGWEDDDGDEDADEDDDPLPTRIALPSGLRSFKLTGMCPIRYLLRYVLLTPSLVELDLNRMSFAQIQLLRLLRLIRDVAPNLERLRLSKCGLSYLHVDDEYSYAATLEEFRNERFLVPIKRIELDRLSDDYLHFKFAIEALLQFSMVESISITASHFVKEIYGLTPIIVDKAATLQLSIIGNNNNPNGIDEIPVPTELARIVTKYEMVKVHCPKVFRPMFVDTSFDRLTDMRLERCRGLGDAELAIVAGWCKSLENLYYEPDTWDIRDVLTDQCLLPFLGFWDDRRSKKLVIECLKPAAPFGGFNLPADRDTGGFTDDKRWARYRKTFLADGNCQLWEKKKTITLPQENGTRLEIWDSAGKSMVITDYKRNVDRNFEIGLDNGGCHIAETRGPIETG